MAWLRVSTSVLVSPLSSPPTIDFRPAPIWLPRCRDLTVSPKTSPITSCTLYPGTSFVVTTRTSLPGPCPPPYSSMPMAPASWGKEHGAILGTPVEPGPGRLRW